MARRVFGPHAQRVVALNLFLQDVYGPQRILKERNTAADIFTAR